MSNKTLMVWNKLREPPQTITSQRTVYCAIDGRNIVYIITLREIIKYDLDQQTILKKIPFDRHLLYSYEIIVSAQLHSESHQIYIMTSNMKIRSFDTISERFAAVSEGEHLRNPLRLSFIHAPSNQIHLTLMSPGSERLVKFEVATQKVSEIPSNHLLFGDCFNTGFVQRRNPCQLFMFRASHRHRKSVLFCNMPPNNQENQSLIWKKHHAQFPSDQHQFPMRFTACLAFDCLLFVFSKQLKGAYVLDLSLDDKAKWEKFEIDLSMYEAFGGFIWIKDAFFDKQHNIHLFSSGRSNDSDASLHVKASVFDLIPTAIAKANKKKYDPLIVGFVKRVEKEHNHLTVPIYLSKMILNFFPFHA